MASNILFSALAAMVACSFMLPSAANPVAAGTEFESDHCRGQVVDEPDLDKVLNEARGGAMTVTHKHFSDLNLRTVTDRSRDHCPNTITGRKNSRHDNARAACPWYVLLSLLL